jgi:hypothetical protein
MDLSNKTLAFLLVVAIVISLGGTIISLNKLNQLGVTGQVTNSNDTGIVQFSLQSNVMITFAVDTIDFGTGYINATCAGIQYCNISTNETFGWNDTQLCGADQIVTCLGALVNDSPFIIRNDGNIDVNLSVNSSKTAATFIAGTTPVFKWAFSNNEASSCTGTLNDTVWTAVNTSPIQNHVVCDNFNYGDADTLRMDIFVSVPEDAPQNAKSATIYARGWA